MFCSRAALLLLVALLLSCSGFAQDPISPAPQKTPAPVSGQKPEQQPTEQSSDKPGAPQTKITPQQAEQLFRDVDTILDYASKDTSLPIKHGVRRRLTSREEVVSYLQKSMAEDKDVQRLKRTELVLKKFGLLPKEVNVQTFLVGLVEEQIAGYYDSKTKTVNLLDW